MKNLSDIYTISINSEIVSTNFWDDYDSPFQEAHLSFKMGVLRILCPTQSGLRDIELMKQAKEAFIVRFPDNDPHLFCVDFTDQAQVSQMTIFSKNSEIEKHLPTSAEGSPLGVVAYLPDQDGRPVCHFRGFALYLLGN